ncbi:GNAT family N-acetyltransferase [Alkalihalobacillus trypoxylicola]|uniref:GNAT family acetyltransferase n=1 Tax=Alkalihalobacillus trypoxylicola TaxID=519424 RepID=A0A161PC21_9BACI|nr:GNAT family N-acetyltransferase [Alkalihalobacillus trypoxylicola]KYG29389.1 GNAT family acetyltransferase [Alkalihalobacillus trypoxylicola]
MQITYTSNIPSKDAFHYLYDTTGWNLNQSYTADQLHLAIHNSWYTVSAYDQNELIGFGRMISDGIYQTFICDMIVHPDYQSKGIGSHILEQLLQKCKSSNIKWIQLSSAKGKAPFYEKFGFTKRSSDAPGMYRLDM